MSLDIKYIEIHFILLLIGKRKGASWWGKRTRDKMLQIIWKLTLTNVMTKNKEKGHKILQIIWKPWPLWWDDPKFCERSVWVEHIGVYFLVLIGLSVCIALLYYSCACAWGWYSCWATLVGDLDLPIRQHPALVSPQILFTVWWITWFAFFQAVT